MFRADAGAGIGRWTQLWWRGETRPLCGEGAGPLGLGSRPNGGARGFGQFAPSGRHAGAAVPVRPRPCGRADFTSNYGSRDTRPPVTPSPRWVRGRVRTHPRPEVVLGWSPSGVCAHSRCEVVWVRVIIEDGNCAYRDSA